MPHLIQVFSACQFVCSEEKVNVEIYVKDKIRSSLIFNQAAAEAYDTTSEVASYASGLLLLVICVFNLLFYVDISAPFEEKLDIQAVIGPLPFIFSGRFFCYSCCFLYC